jgi:hypothetical protein
MTDLADVADEATRPHARFIAGNAPAMNESWPHPTPRNAYHRQTSQLIPIPISSCPQTPTPNDRHQEQRRATMKFRAGLQAKDLALLNGE